MDHRLLLMPLHSLLLALPIASIHHILCWAILKSYSGLCPAFLLLLFIFLLTWLSFRHYNRVEKWAMREIAFELGSSALTPAHCYQAVQNFLCDSGSSSFSPFSPITFQDSTAFFCEYVSSHNGVYLFLNDSPRKAALSHLHRVMR